MALPLSMEHARGQDGGIAFSSEPRVIGFAEDPGRLRTADLDGDGDQDVLVPIHRGALWFENLGGSDLEFVEHQFLTRVTSSSLQAADLDGDGDLDVIKTLKFGFCVVWFENLGGFPVAFSENQEVGELPQVHPPPSPNFDPQPSGVRVFAADLDGDGDIDIAGKANEALGWFQNDGAPDPSFTFRAIVGEGFDGYDGVPVIAADIDGDGNLDIVSTTNGADGGRVDVAWYANDGRMTPRFELRTMEPHTPVNQTDLRVGDMDGDGDIDILSFATFSIGYFENDGAAEPEFTPHLIGQEIRILAIELADLDGDGLPDLLMSVHSRLDRTFTRKTQWRRNLGGTPLSFGAPRILDSATHMMTISADIHAADLDGDGDLDVLSSLNEEGRVEWFENIPMPINAARHWLNYR